MGAVFPSFAADRTISSDYALTSDETVDGILTVESGVTVDLNGYNLVVQGLAGGGTINFTNNDLTSPDPNGERVTWSVKGTAQGAIQGGTPRNLFNNNYARANTDNSKRILLKCDSHLPLAVDYDFGEGNEKTINMYKMYCGPWGNASTAKRGPKTWTFAGSNDKETWTTLDSRNSVTWATDQETKSYTFNNSTAYRYYRITVTAATATDYLEIVQLEYFDTSIRPELHVAVPQGEVSVNSTVAITGNVCLVADGLGEFVSAKAGQTYTGGTLLAAGKLTMDGVTASGLTLGTNGGAPVVFDYGGQSMQRNPADYLVTGSEVTLTNGTFWMSGGMSIRDSTKIPSVLTIAKGATLCQSGENVHIIDKNNGTATVNVVGGTLGKTGGSTSSSYSYLQHASLNGRLNVNVTDGGVLTYSHILRALCGGNIGTTPSLYMMFADSTFIVENGATLALNSGADIGTGAVTVKSGGTLEVAQSGMARLNGNLSLADGAALGFNFTQRGPAPVLAIAGDATLTVEGAVAVKISSANGLWPIGGEKVLTTCGGFNSEGVSVSLAAGAPSWVQDSLSVNADGDIVIDVKPKGAMVSIR